jgi:hypothetical protein
MGTLDRTLEVDTAAKAIRQAQSAWFKASSTQPLKPLAGAYLQALGKNYIFI